MPNLQLLLFIGVGVLFFVVFFFSFLRRFSKAGKVKRIALENPSLNVDFLDVIIEKLGESLELSHVLDVVIDKFETKVLYSAASYILKDSDTEVTFKSIIKPGVSRKLIEEAKTKLFLEFERITGAAPFSFAVEEYVVGGSLGEKEGGKIGSYLCSPLYRKQELVGCFSLYTTQENAYSDSAKTYIDMALREVLAVYERLIGLVNKEKEKLQGIVDNMHEGVLVVDKNLKVLVENPSVSNLIGVKALVDLNFLDLSDFFTNAFSLEDEVAQVFNSNMPKKISNIEKDAKFFEVTLLPITNANVVVRVGIIIADQTEEKELEKLRRDFSAMVIHELRSPLSVIKGTVEVIMGHENELSQEEKTKFFEQIKTSSTFLLNKVGNLLDAAKIEEKRIELFRELTDINDLLAETKDFFINLASQKRLQLTTDLDDSLIQVYIDSKKVIQVLNNLVSNAIKYTPNGGSIVLKSQNKGDCVEISVSDTGEGIADDLKAKLFERYVRGKDNAGNGTGLGLVIAKGIAEAHNGKIWIEDNLPHGSRFVFSLAKQTN